MCWPDIKVMIISFLSNDRPFQPVRIHGSLFMCVRHRANVGALAEKLGIVIINKGNKSERMLFRRVLSDVHLVLKSVYNFWNYLIQPKTFSVSHLRFSYLLWFLLKSGCGKNLHVRSGLGGPWTKIAECLQAWVYRNLFWLGCCE